MNNQPEFISSNNYRFVTYLGATNIAFTFAMEQPVFPFFKFTDNMIKSTVKIHCHFVFENPRPLSLFPQFLRRIKEVFQGELDFLSLLEFSLVYGSFGVIS